MMYPPQIEPTRSSRSFATLSNVGLGWRETVLALPAAEFWNDRSAAIQFLEAIERDMISCSPSYCQKILSIPAPSPEGFGISLYVDRKGVFGWFGGLSCEFYEIERALEWTRRALSCEYRLHIVCVRGYPCEWMLESVVGAVVVMASRVGIPLRRWFTPTHIYKTNGLLAVGAGSGPTIGQAWFN